MAAPQEQSQQSDPDTNPGKSEPAGSDTEEDNWDEERIEQALKVSKEMHIQVGYW